MSSASNASAASMRPGSMLHHPACSAKNLQRVIDHHGEWPDLLAVCKYFLAHPRPGRYARELPIGVHTKFIEEHSGILRRLLDALLPPDAINVEEQQFEARYGLARDEPLVRLRLLDPGIGPQIGLPVADVSAPLPQIATLPLNDLRCVIVENMRVFLTLPALPATIAIFGSGFAVERLVRLPWLRTCRLWYWGDLDAQGFQILSRLRSHFPHAHPLMMDGLTFAAFEAFAVPGTACPVEALPGLAPDEQALFARLAGSNLRLEQERISHAYAEEQLRRALEV